MGHKSTSIALEWYKYGLEKNDDFFIKFMTHWMAFNWLYTRNDIKEKNEGKNAEWNNIDYFVRKNYYCLCKFSPTSIPEIEIFKKYKVMDNRHKKEYELTFLDETKSQVDIISMFRILYQIRCNLFHGSKSFLVEKDIDLVKASAVILENYMKKLIPVMEKYKD